MLDVSAYRRSYRDRHGRQPTQAELSGMDRAFQDIEAGRSTLPRVALGAGLGLNDDWPEAMRQAALKEYGLSG